MGVDTKKSLQGMQALITIKVGDKTVSLNELIEKNKALQYKRFYQLSFEEQVETLRSRIEDLCNCVEALITDFSGSNPHLTTDWPLAVKSVGF